MTQFYEKVRDRLIRYAKVDTQSRNGVSERPTTVKQFDLARMLKAELEEIGVSEVWLDEKYCVVYGKIPANTEGEHKALGLVAHMDTAPDASGTDVKPWVLENYQGQDIVLNKEKNIVMAVADFPNLKNYIGQDLVLTDGTTLLGGDDKASISAIMTMAEYLCANPDIPHGDICLAFTPDEEVGGLARDLDLQRFGSPTAYTLDGDYLGYYEDETFNASAAKVTITGRSVHTGTAKGIMINSVDIGAEFMNMLPAFEKPQYTDGREGFYHVTSFNGSCEYTEIHLIIRDHSAVEFAHREAYLQKVTDELNRKFGNVVTLEINETYRSMKEVVDQVPYLVERLVRAISDCGVEPHDLAFRGGTDGSALSHRGLPCPNLSAGYENAHGRFEYVPIQSMEKNVEILLRLVQIYAEED
ncbi:MAG: peptidase T [Erysipelotrichaceae bacterium]|nr:peptidase T [Erysipelotrichaceae bacterium]